MLEKRNIVETRRTPEHELYSDNEDWDKEAADQMVVKSDLGVDVRTQSGIPTENSNV